MTNETPDRDRVLEIARDARFAMLTSRSAEGELHSRPMTPQRVDDDATAWFLVAQDTDQARDVASRREVNLAFSENSQWLSIAGHAEILDDRQLIDEFWSSATEAWFPEGPEDPRLRVLKVTGVSAEYWAAPGGRVATVISFLKAKATGESLNAENEELDL